MDINFFKGKNWCDAKDNTGEWRMARIKRNIRGIVTVHFDGWSDKWNLHYCIHSPMIAPFRKHSKGYTGQGSVTLREWDFSENILKTYDSKVKTLKQKGFREFSPYELTMFLRGDLFIQLDAIMTYIFSNPTTDLELVKEFMVNLLELLLKWLELAPDLYSQCGSMEDYWVHLPTSVYRSVHEVCEMLCSLLGLNPRTSKFFDKYSHMVSKSLFVNMFLAKGGINFLARIIDSDIPFLDYWALVSSIRGLFTENTEQFNQELVPALKETLLAKSQKFPDAPELRQVLDSFDVVSPSSPEPPKLVEHPKQSEDFAAEIEEIMSISDIEEVKESNEEMVLNDLKSLIEERHDECVNMILNKLAEIRRSRRNASNLQEMELVVKSHEDCDKQEYALLCYIEYMIVENQTQEALKCVKWRKNLLSVAEANGWEVALDVSKNTAHTQLVSDKDIIEGNLRCIQKRFKQING